MLICTDLTLAFGDVLALHGVDLQVATGEIVGLIGPNGSGKSTLINVISGFLRPGRGRVEVDGRDTTRLGASRLRRLGISRTFQNLRLYPDLTVMENVLLGLHVELALGRAMHWSFLADIVPSERVRSRERVARERGRAALEDVGLGRKAEDLARNLSYGEQKRLELARAVVVQPKLLILDEPTAGLSPDEAIALMARFADLFRGAPDRGLLIAEHHVDLVASLCSHLVVLDAGRVIKTGIPDEVLADEEVIRIYVGE